ncbi:MAG: methyltransferase domain-containing protein [Oligoflexia bacterium]|nr:methyltransferase domain-containing protein [Oligoflexia bacterium]
MEYPNAVNQHYGQADLAEKILTALQNIGKDVDNLTQDDLSPFDQFHSGGLAATMRLAQLVELHEGIELLDVGCGIGGPARILATEYGCHVTGIELTETFCHAAELLTARLGLSDKISFQHGNALDLPFENASFDLVWTQNVLMNIEDKKRLFGEMHRVLRPNGRLALFSLMQGPVPTLHYPVIWASSPDLAFLIPPDELRQLVIESGFREISWIEGLNAGSHSTALPVEKNGFAVGMDILVEKAFELKKANGKRNMEEKRTTYVTGVFERTDTYRDA